MYVITHYIVSSFHLGVDHPAAMTVNVLFLLYHILYCCQTIFRLRYTYEKLKIKQKKILKS